MTLLAATDTTSRAAGPFGLLVVVLLGIALVLLIRNMDRRIKKLPRDFPEDGRGVQRTDSPDGPHGPEV